MGPLLFLGATLVLLGKIGALLASRVWVVCLVASLILTCWITWMVLQEWLLNMQKMRKAQSQNEEEVKEWRARLEQTHAEYLSKIELLEKQWQATLQGKAEKEQTAALHLQELEEKYDLMLEEALNDKNHASSLAASLEDALTELHALRQLEYLWTEKQKLEPADAAHKYRQLHTQFEEQAEKLHQMKRDLFTLEGELILLRKQQEEEELLAPELFQSIFEQTTENEQLMHEVAALEEVLTLQIERSQRKKKATPVETILELKF